MCCRSNFGDDKAARRDAIMGAIIARATDANAIARRWAFDCMTRVGDIYYRSIEPYIDQLAHATSTAALNDENVSVATSTDTARTVGRLLHERRTH